MADAGTVAGAVAAAVAAGRVAAADQAAVNMLLQHAASMQNQIMLKEGKEGLMKLKADAPHLFKSGAAAATATTSHS